ncbi:MgtC/SapB family protein [Geminocystis sp.]|uniref:MgtC/SapB family protein n=1 Tax=Geminocystis sp. TaxID=2664100 RepID=UPI003593BC18
MEDTEFIIRLIIALLLGSGLGLERQWRQRMARLLTNSLVCIGACLFVMLSMMIEGDSSRTRVIAQVVSGIGFLAGGVILREGASIRGLNTAATIWCTAAVGALTGAGFISKAFIGSLVVLFAHLFLTPLGEIINQISSEEEELELCYCCSFICHHQDELKLRAIFLRCLKEKNNFEIRSIHSEKLRGMVMGVKIQAEIVAKTCQDQELDHIISNLSLEPTVIKATWQTIFQN